MSDERKSSVVVIVASVGMIVTMIFHPHGRVTPAQLESMIRVNLATHALALVSTALLFLGALGIAKWLGGPDRLGVAGLVLFGFAAAAVMNAGMLNGLVAPQLMRNIVAAADETRNSWKLILDYNFSVNQAFAKVYAVGAGLAIAVWSVAIWKRRQGAVGIAVYGCILGAVAVAGIFSGLLRTDVHGFQMLVFGQAIWFLLVAGKMWNEGKSEVTT